MRRYVALLRGINLGNRNRVPMGELRTALGEQGFSAVRSHLQSGNVVFDHASTEPGVLADEIAGIVTDRFGVRAAVLVRMADEIAGVVERNPLGAQPNDPAKFLVAFLESEPDPRRARELEERDFGGDRVWVSGREAYLWCPGGLRGSELGRLAWDKQLGVTATARNWNTVLRLASMATQDTS